MCSVCKGGPLKPDRQVLRHGGLCSRCGTANALRATCLRLAATLSPVERLRGSLLDAYPGIGKSPFQRAESVLLGCLESPRTASTKTDLKTQTLSTIRSMARFTMNHHWDAATLLARSFLSDWETAPWSVGPRDPVVLFASLLDYFDGRLPTQRGRRLLIRAFQEHNTTAADLRRLVLGLRRKLPQDMVFHVLDFIEEDEVVTLADPSSQLNPSHFYLLPAFNPLVPKQNTGGGRAGKEARKGMDCKTFLALLQEVFPAISHTSKNELMKQFTNRNKFMKLWRRFLESDAAASRFQSDFPSVIWYEAPKKSKKKHKHGHRHRHRHRLSKDKEKEKEKQRRKRSYLREKAREAGTRPRAGARGNGSCSASGSGSGKEGKSLNVKVSFL